MLSTAPDTQVHGSTEDLLFDMADKACVRAWADEGWGPVHMKLLTTAMTLEHQGFKTMSGKTQNDKIIDHIIANGSISQREAIMDYSIQSLTKRISELREMGFPVLKTMKRHPVTGQSYARYYLPETKLRAMSKAA